MQTRIIDTGVSAFPTIIFDSPRGRGCVDDAPERRRATLPCSDNLQKKLGANVPVRRVIA